MIDRLPKMDRVSFDVPDPSLDQARLLFCLAGNPVQGFAFKKHFLGAKQMKVILQTGLRGLSGSMEDWVYQYRNGKTYLGPKHPSTKPPTEGMIAQRAHFKDARDYAVAALEDEATREFYTPFAEERGWTLYTTAVTDFLNAPEIKPLDLSTYKGQVGDKIVIRAEDDFGMADVDVKITADDGTQIEQGKAIEKGLRSGTWIYTATRSVALGSDIFIEVVGLDHAGTEARVSESPRVGADA
jgi:hypothetical protein